MGKLNNMYTFDVKPKKQQQQQKTSEWRQMTDKNKTNTEPKRILFVTKRNGMASEERRKLCN